MKETEKIKELYVKIKLNPIFMTDVKTGETILAHYETMFYNTLIGIIPETYEKLKGEEPITSKDETIEAMTVMYDEAYEQGKEYGERIGFERGFGESFSFMKESKEMMKKPEIQKELKKYAKLIIEKEIAKQKVKKS